MALESKRPKTGHALLRAARILTSDSFKAMEEDFIDDGMEPEMDDDYMGEDDEYEDDLMDDEDDLMGDVYGDDEYEDEDLEVDLEDDEDEATYKSEGMDEDMSDIYESSLSSLLGPSLAEDDDDDDDDDEDDDDEEEVDVEVDEARAAHAARIRKPKNRRIPKRATTKRRSKELLKVADRISDPAVRARIKSLSRKI